MKIFYKDVSNRSETEIKNEITFQKKVASLGLTPKIINTDYKTFIEMEHLDELCLADMYGESIKDIPEIILKKIYDILVQIYLECDIAYLDVTPYNFIEKGNKIWIIDFGDARKAPDKDWWLQETFENGAITQWNPEFL
jgi:tRNA A-37 threonylcarbamoyl transferase component Bud32